MRSPHGRPSASSCLMGTTACPLFSLSQNRASGTRPPLPPRARPSGPVPCGLDLARLRRPAAPPACHTVPPVAFATSIQALYRCFPPSLFSMCHRYGAGLPPRRPQIVWGHLSEGMVLARCVVSGYMCCSIKHKDMDLALECVAMVTAPLPCYAGLQARSAPRRTPALR